MLMGKFDAIALFAPVVITGDDSHRSGVVRQFDIWNLRLEQGLITRFRALVLRAQVHPKLHHLESAAFAREILRMEFLVDDAVASSHPLHISRSNLSAAAAGVAMLYLALISNRHGFKAFVRMPAHTALFITGRKFIRRGVVEQQERTQLTAKTIVIEHGAHREAVADPVHSRTLMG